MNKNSSAIKNFVAASAVILTIWSYAPVQKADASTTLYWPVPGHTNLSRNFAAHNNEAIDINDSKIHNAEIHAALGGVIDSIYTCTQQHYGSMHTCDGMGTGVIIKGTDGRYYNYAHMEPGSIPKNVVKGAKVEGNQIIGKVGTTGNSSGYHLHFAIHVGGKWKNPANPEKETYYSKTGDILSITAAASKTTYWLYEGIDTSGLSLKLTKSDGTSKTITSGFKVSADMTKAGTVPVTISYTDTSGTTTATYNITVKHPFKGTGTAADPYLISNSADLVRLAKVINGNYITTSNGKKVGYNFLYYRQTEDIDLTDVKFTPIGVCYKDYSNIDITDNITNDNVFSGVYDGNNHTVSNLSIKDYKHCYCGLFGKLATATVKNLAVTGEVISSNICTGGIIGETGYNSTVTGCSFNGKVEGAGSTGGIVGCFFTGGKISDCYVNADIKDISGLDNRGSGGITGRISVGTRDNALSVDALLENCYFTGTVEGKLTGTATGIKDIGTVQTGRTITIKNVYTDSDIKSKDDTGVTFVKTADLKSLSDMSSLSFVKSSKSQNSGYPVFAWQKTENENDDEPEIVVGDINGDTVIDMTDLSDLSLWLIGENELTDEQQLAADATGDGNLDLADLAHLKQYISKTINWIGKK